MHRMTGSKLASKIWGDYASVTWKNNPMGQFGVCLEATRKLLAFLFAAMYKVMERLPLQIKLHWKQDQKQNRD